MADPSVEVPSSPIDCISTSVVLSGFTLPSIAELRRGGHLEQPTDVRDIHSSFRSVLRIEGGTTAPKPLHYYDLC